MLIWDLITMLLIFQAKYPLEELDVLREIEHSRKERCKIKTFATVQLFNFIYAFFKILIPLGRGVDGSWYNESTMYTVILAFDVAYFVAYFLVIAFHSTRVVLIARFYYKDAYDKHKWSYLCLTIIFIFSCITLFTYNVFQLGAQDCLNRDDLHCA